MGGKRKFGTVPGGWRELRVGDVLGIETGLVWLPYCLSRQGRCCGGRPRITALGERASLLHVKDLENSNIKQFRCPQKEVWMKTSEWFIAIPTKTLERSSKIRTNAKELKKTAVTETSCKGQQLAHNYLPQEVREWLSGVTPEVSTQPGPTASEGGTQAQDTGVEVLHWGRVALYSLWLINFEKDARSSLVIKPLSTVLWSVCLVAFWANTAFTSHSTSCNWNGKNCLTFIFGLASWEFYWTPTDQNANKSASDIHGDTGA